MVDLKEIQVLLRSFPGSFVNSNLEAILDVKTNQYICLEECETVADIKCKLLEWLSRAAHKGMPYRVESRNVAYRETLRDGINQYLGTNFSEEDMEQIYIHLGNGINRAKSMRFVNSGYDMSVLVAEEKEEPAVITTEDLEKQLCPDGLLDKKAEEYLSSLPEVVRTAIEGFCKEKNITPIQLFLMGMNMDNDKGFRD